MAPIDISATNISDGETVHQRCLLVTGKCTSFSAGGDIVSVTTTGANGIEAFPEQSWPVAGGSFKALVILSPGPNTLQFSHLHNDNFESSTTITLTYIPLLQYPPLHLAIMIAKDSPLVIDCPSHKRGGFSSAHSDLDAAIAKFRMTAYMWQAMTAEDFRSKGLGRRTFRLDEEWAADTLSRDFINARHDESLDREGAIRATAKVHIIRSSKTTKEIRSTDVAQQNHSGNNRDGLFNYFTDALREAGGPFESSAHPVVAGLILDSHYSVTKKLILGHAALGGHNPDGISLGMFGSHLTYSWPRFLEEVTSCLTDIKAPGDKVGNDNVECPTMWEACTIGQGAHLHEVGHAFGSPHRPGIMMRGYAQDWPKNFLSQTAYSRHLKTEGVVITDSTPNDAQWNLIDALSFRILPHFRLPTDQVLVPLNRDVYPQADVEYEGEEKLNAILRIFSPVGIVRIIFSEVIEEKFPSVAEPVSELRFTQADLEARFDHSNPLSLHILGSNGKEVNVPDVWRLLSGGAIVRIPGSSIRLLKRSVYSGEIEKGSNHKVYEWAQLLRERGPDGQIHRATSIDLRVGCLWDGGVVKYGDGHTSHWGPMKHEGRRHSFGGHASEKIRLPVNANIQCIEVNRGDQNSALMDGVRMTLTNGTSAGELNRSAGQHIVKLEPGPHEVIVGFYGKSDREDFAGMMEFGIFTAPKAVGIDGLPNAVFDLPELKNRAGLLDRETVSEDEDEDEDEDGWNSDDGSQNNGVDQDTSYSSDTLE